MSQNTTPSVCKGWRDEGSVSTFASRASGCSEVPVMNRVRLGIFGVALVVFFAALALLVPMHVGAALKHHFWDRHDVLEGMLPEIPDGQGHPQGSQHAPPPAASGTPAIGG